MKNKINKKIKKIVSFKIKERRKTCKYINHNKKWKKTKKINQLIPKAQSKTWRN